LSRTPGISKTFTPGRDSTVTPVIGSIEPSLIFDLVPHSSVFILSTGDRTIAIVVFQIRDVLIRRQKRNIVLLVLVATWVSTTGFVS